MTARITQQDRQMVDFIISYTDENGFPPSRRLLAEHLGKAGATVQFRLERLVREGVIERHPGVSRGIRVNRDRINQLGGG